MKIFGKDINFNSVGKIFLKLFAGLMVVIVAAFGVAYVKRVIVLNAAIQYFLPDALQEASKKFGVKIKVGEVFTKELEFSSLPDSSIIANNIEVFDANDELMAKVDTVKVTAKVLPIIKSQLSGNLDVPGAIDEIDVDGVTLSLKKREDDLWNFQDFKIPESEESTFGAKVNVSKGAVTAEFDGKNISVDEIELFADCADMDAIETELSAATLGSHIIAKGTVGADKQYVNASVDNAYLSEILPYLPADIIPEGVEIHDGKASNTIINILRRGEVLSYSGFTKFSDGAVRVEQTEIENIEGSATFTDAQYNIIASAEANGQPATIKGTLRTDTDKLYFDFNAESEKFVPAAIIENIGIDGAAGFTAHVFGTVDNPKVEAKISSDYLGYENLSARNVKTDFRYANNAVYLSNIYAETFGGAVTGEFELDAQTLSYNSHFKANDINIAQVRNYAGSDVEVVGNVNADLAVNGTGADLTTLKVYGSASGNNIYYQNFLVNNMESSFFLNEDDIKFDYLNLTLPNHGTVNLEGTLVDLNKLDLNFYGAHCDLALAKTFDPNISVGGLSDFSGSIHGDIDNPQIALTLSAIGDPRMKVDGEILNQKFDSLNLDISGSLDAINVANFELEKGGKIQWQVMDGQVNLKERKLNVRLDTVGARLEGIVKMLAPDQQLTGEIDNTIRVQGTFENPELVGYVEMHYGSYQGILISGMRGDYYIEDGDKFRLQDFEIITPMVDIVLNGTLNIKNYALDMVVHGREIDLRRFQHQFPYEVSGSGQFEGVISGTVNSPKFDGQLTSDSFVFNGVELNDISGHIGATATSVVLDDVKFTQGEGKYEMYLGADIASGAMSGEAKVENADIESLAALANYKTKVLSGALTSTIEVGGTMKNPTVRLIGSIPKGAVGTHDLHEIQLDMNLINEIANIRTFKGYQGENGTFEVAGSANLHGPIDLTASAKKIELGVFGAFAGMESEFVGDADLSVKVTGDVNNPEGAIFFTSTGGIKGSTFDLLEGHVLLKDWIFDVKDLTVQRALGEKVYSANAKGQIPMEALYIENENPSAEMNLQVSFDDADLSLLPVLSDAVAWATGEMAGKLDITGTAANPHINGNISLADGTVKVKGMKNSIEHINIATEFIDDKFVIDDFSGNVGTGKFTLGGGLSFANFKVSDYKFDFVADALDIQSVFFTGPLNAEFSLTEEPMRDKTLPKISGHLDLEKCLFSVPTIPESEDEMPEILLDVAINLGDKVHFYSSRLYNMYLTGSVKFENSTTHPKPSGIISVKRGATVNYLTTVFDVREGELFFNQLDSFLPSLNFSADARVSNIKIELSVTGPLDNAQVKLTSNPEKTETEIMQILTLRDAYGNQTSNMSMADVLALGLQMSVLGDIEDTVKRNLGLDKFTFSSGSGSALDSFASKEDSNNQEQEFNISVGKYVTDKLMLKYTQGINGDKVTRYGIQYDLNDNLGLTAERESSEFIFSLEARYKF